MKSSKKDKQSALQFPDRFAIFAADLSLKRPGFCKLFLEKNEGELSVADIRTFCVDNKKSTAKPKGQLMDEVFNALKDEINNFVECKEKCFFVRQKSVNSFGGRDSMSSKTSVAAIVGLADYALWLCAPKEVWHEIYPVSVKKLLTGFGKAQKKDVAEALKKYVGDHQYACDDESDATAVAVAWLMQNNQIKNNQEDLNNEKKRTV